VWRQKCNELAAKYKAAQSDLKRYTRVAQEHATKNQQLQEAYLKLKSELERQHGTIVDLKRLQKERQNDQKVHDARYKSLASEFSSRRQQEQQAFQDQIANLQETIDVEMQRAAFLQKQHKKDLDTWKLEMSRVSSMMSKEKRSYEMKMASMHTTHEQNLKILLEQKSRLEGDVEHLKAKNQKLQALVKMSDDDQKLEMAEKEIEDLLTTKRQLSQDLEKCCLERDEAVVKLEAERLNFLTEKKALIGNIKVAEQEALSTKRAYDQLHKENLALHRENINLGNRVVEVETHINEKHKQLLDTNKELKSVQEVADKRVASIEQLSQKRLDEITIQITGKEKELEAAVKERDRSKVQLGYNSRSQTEALKRAEEVAAAEKAKLSREIEMLTHHKNELKDTAAQKIAKLEARIKELELTHDNRLNELQQGKATISQLHAQLDKIQAVSERTQKDLDMHAKELSETHKELEFLQAKHRNLQEKEHKESEQIQASAVELASLKNRYADAKSEINQLRKALLLRSAKHNKTVKENASVIDKQMKDKKKLKKIVMTLRGHIRDAAIGKEQMEKANEVIIDTKTMELQMVKKQLVEIEKERDDLKRRRIAEVALAE